MEAASLAELSVLNPLTRLRRLHLETSLADGRLEQLKLGANVMVNTPGDLRTDLNLKLCCRLDRLLPLTCNSAHWRF